MPERSTTLLRRMRGAICAGIAMLAAVPAAAHATTPSNDAFADAQTVRVGDRVTGSTAEATLEAGEPAPSNLLFTRSIWYRVTPTLTEPLRIDSCAGATYAELAIYSGAAVGSLAEVEHTERGCGRGTRRYVTLTAGTTYHVRLTAYDGFNGDVVLNLARPQAPANDDFEDAQPVGRPARLTGSIVDATLQPGEPQGFAGNDRSVWFRYTARAAELVVVSTCGSSSPLAVYTGTSVGALTEVGTEGGACGYHAAMSFITTAGASYYISVTGEDDFVLDVSAPDPPPNPIGNFPPPPTPTCPFVFAGDGVTYRGTHSAGGDVCMTLTKDFSGVAWFHALDVPGDTCRIGWKVERIELPTPIVDKRFSHGSSFARIIGSFTNGRSASGTVQMTQLTGPLSFCKSPVLTWTATTTATPPWLDEQPPALALRGSTVQRPLRQRYIALRVHCRSEACTARASATVAGVRLTADRLAVPAGSRGRIVRLVLGPRATRAVRAALRSRSGIRTRVAVVATDAPGNRATARRTITLRR